MITFLQFVEIFDSAPSRIHWSSQRRGFFGKAGLLPVRVSEGDTLVKSGDFVVGNERYTFFARISDASRNRLLQKISKRNAIGGIYKR